MSIIVGMKAVEVAMDLLPRRALGTIIMVSMSINHIDTYKFQIEPSVYLENKSIGLLVVILMI